MSRKFYNVQTVNARNVFNGNGVTTVFTTDFAFIVAASLKVTLVSAASVETVQVLNTNYTVSGGLNSQGNPDVGSVTMLVAPPVGSRLVVERIESYVQPSTFQRFGGIPIKVVELCLDRLTLLVQQLFDLSGRTLRYPSSEPLITSGVLPGNANRAGKYLFFNASTGAPEAAAGTADATPHSALMVSLHNAADAAAARAVLGAGVIDPFSGLAEDATPDISNDFLLSYDISASAAKKIKPSSISLLGIGFLRLNGSAPGSAKTASWTANEIVVATSLGGNAYKGGSKTFSFNGATTGANGMDTGSTPTSGDLYVYAIYNPTTQTWACLGTISGSGANIYGGANMPSGYVASALIWAGKTDGSGNLVSFTQRDRKIWRTKTFVLTGGTQTIFTSISLSSAVPVCAVAVSGNAGVDSTITNLGVSVAADSNGIAEHVMVAATAGGFNFGNFSGSVPFTDLPIMTSQTMYYKVTSGGSCRVEINGYSF